MTHNILGLTIVFAILWAVFAMGSAAHATPSRICLYVPSAIPPTTDHMRGHCERKAKGDDTGNPSLDYTCHFAKGDTADCYKDGACFVCAGMD